MRLRATFRPIPHRYPAGFGRVDTTAHLSHAIAIASAAASVPMSGPKAATSARLTLGPTSRAKTEKASSDSAASVWSLTGVVPLITTLSAPTQPFVRRAEQDFFRMSRSPHFDNVPLISGTGGIVANHVELTGERLNAMRERDPSGSFDMINLLKFRPIVADGLGIDGTEGRYAYLKYYASTVSRIFVRLEIAAEMLYMNQAHATLLGLEGEEWDLVAIVRYPSRAKFLEMQDDPEYRDIMPFRTGSLVNCRLIEALAAPPSDRSTPARPMPEQTVVEASQGTYVDPRSRQLPQRDPDEPTYMLNLVRYKNEADSGAGVDGLDGSAAYRRYGLKLLESEVGRAAGLEAVWTAYPLEPLIGPAEELWDVALMAHYPSRRQMVEMFGSEEYRRDHAPLRAAALSDSRLIETTPR